MSIDFNCRGCGKLYRVDEKMAGKQAKCRCGASTQVPREVAEDDQGNLEDWVAAAFRPSADSRPAPEPTPTPVPEPGPEATPPASAEDRPERKRRRKRKPSRWSKLTAIASIVYGVLAVSVLLTLVVLYFPFGILFWGADAVLAAAVAVGGVLILKRHRNGPACAGLAAIFLCFFGAANAFGNIVGALTVGSFIEALVDTVYLLVVYTVPAGIVWWCLIEEMKIQQGEAEELESRAD